MDGIQGLAFKQAMLLPRLQKFMILDPRPRILHNILEQEKSRNRKQGRFPKTCPCKAITFHRNFCASTNTPSGPDSDSSGNSDLSDRSKESSETGLPVSAFSLAQRFDVPEPARQRLPEGLLGAIKVMNSNPSCINFLAYDCFFNRSTLLLEFHSSKDSSLLSHSGFCIEISILRFPLLIFWKERSFHTK